MTPIDVPANQRMSYRIPISQPQDMKDVLDHDREAKCQFMDELKKASKTPAVKDLCRRLDRAETTEKVRLVLPVHEHIGLTKRGFVGISQQNKQVEVEELRTHHLGHAKGLDETRNKVFETIRARQDAADGLRNACKSFVSAPTMAAASAMAVHTGVKNTASGCCDGFARLMRPCWFDASHEGDLFPPLPIWLCLICLPIVSCYCCCASVSSCCRSDERATTS